jgi:glycosyltransferase involved in cell wall biosynthesis
MSFFITGIIDLIDAMLKLFRITTVPVSLEKLLTGQLQFMSQYYDITAISSDKEHMERFGKEQGLKTYHIEFTRQITLLKDLKALCRLYNYIKNEKPDIVHTHTPKAGLIGMLAAWLAKVPYRLHTVAGMPLMETTGLKRQILNITEKITYKCATKVYPNSVGLKTFIENQSFCHPDKLKIIAGGSSNGIDTSFFSRENVSIAHQKQLQSALGIKQNDVVFCFVGRLVKDKGINELVNAFIGLNSSYKDTKLLLVGPYETELDPLNENIEYTIKTNPAIIETGFQDDVRPYLSISNIFVFPSYREGFPNAVLQAGAMNLPCVVTDINGCNEIITNNVNGIIIPPKNMQELQDAMIDLYIDENKRQKLSSVAREKITSRYDQSYVWHELLKEYQSLKDK